MPADLQPQPPFPALIWTTYGWWEGELVLPALAGMQSRRGPYGSVDRAGPSDGRTAVSVKRVGVRTRPTTVQSAALAHLLDHGIEVIDAVLAGLVAYYAELRDTWDLTDLEMPLVVDPTAFRNLIGVCQAHVHPYERNELAYIGLEFGCAWDAEHGFGVMLHGSRVVEIGAADTSFAWMPGEAQPSI